MEKVNKVRYYYLDMIKIISAFMVTFYHFAHGRINYGFIPGEYYIPNFNRFIMSLCAMSVPLFFMVSGALMLNKERSWKQIIYKCIKLFLLIVIWKFAFCPIWFLRTLAILYILTPILKKVCDMTNKIFMYVVMIALLIMPFIYNYAVVLLQYMNIDYKLNIFGNIIEIKNLSRTGCFTMYSILYYLLGNIMHNKNYTSVKMCISFVILGIVMNLTEVTLVTNTTNKMFDGVNASFPTIGALLMAVGVFGILKCINYNTSWKKMFMKISPYIMGIYLMHLMVIHILFKVIIQVNELSIISAILLSILMDTICVLLGMVIKKIPYVNEIIKI